VFANLFTKLCAWSPGIRRFLWKRWYQHLAGKYRRTDWTFMNYGWAPAAEGECDLDLAADEANDRFCIQLYHRVAAAVPLAGKLVAEVGSGRGGGAHYVARALGPAAMIGADFSPQAVAFCKERHNHPTLSFQVGDAENLPFADASHDAIINVESSHCYGSRPRFFAQVARVLKPGGHFLYADFFQQDMLDQLTAAFATAGLHEVSRQNITPNVLQAMRRDHEHKSREIKTMLSPVVRRAFQEFAGLEGSAIYQEFATNRLTYWVFLIERPTAS